MRASPPAAVLHKLYANIAATAYLVQALMQFHISACTLLSGDCPENQVSLFLDFGQLSG